MIKVLNKKTDEQRLYHQRCDNCYAELECNDEDTYEGAWGSYYVICPECGSECMVDDKLCVKLDSNNIQFPLHFSHLSQNAVKLEDERIQKFVRHCLKSLEDAEEDWGVFSLTGTGNTMVFAFKYEDEYVVYATKDYYETSICRE